MPKKTKKQKLLAEKRRLTPIATGHVHHSETAVSPQPQITFSYHTSQPVSQTSHAADEAAELTVIKKDLTKTILLALTAVVIELGVYRLLRGL